MEIYNIFDQRSDNIFKLPAQPKKFLPMPTATLAKEGTTNQHFGNIIINQNNIHYNLNNNVILSKGEVLDIEKYTEVFF